MMMVLTAALLFFVLLALTLMLKPKPEQMKLTKRQVFVLEFVLERTVLDVAHENTGQSQSQSIHTTSTPSPSSTSPF